MLVTDVDSAVDAIEIIIHQGEGLSDDGWADPDHQELTHYHKLARIHEGHACLGSVRPLRRNPVTADYPDPVAVVSDLFNALYRVLFLILGQIFSAEANQGTSVGLLYLVMGDLMSQTAQFLVDLDLGDGTFAAPTFEYYEFARSPGLDEIRSLADRAAHLFPEMLSVRDAIEGLTLIL